MVKSLVALLCAVTFAHAQSWPPLPTTTRAMQTVAVTLERTACYGTCPVYRVTVNGSGRVEWSGAQHVVARGERARTVAPAKVAELVRRLDRSGFRGWKTAYEEYRITDMASEILTVRWGSAKKTIRWYHGDDSAPKELGEIGKLVDEVAGTADWIGKPKQGR